TIGCTDVPACVQQLESESANGVFAGQPLGYHRQQMRKRIAFEQERTAYSKSARDTQSLTNCLVRTLGRCNRQLGSRRYDVAFNQYPAPSTLGRQQLESVQHVASAVP